MTLSQGLKWSVMAHLGIFIFFVVQNLIFPSRLQMQAPLLRVDLVALPDLTPSELRKLKAHSASKSEAVESSDPRAMTELGSGNPKTRKDRIKMALERLSALRKTQEQSEAEKIPDVIKGNILSKGTSLSESAKETGESSYKDQIQDRLEANFSVPIWLERMKLRSRVLIWIAEDGRVTETQIIQSSGNDQYDQIVQRTIQRSQPFPPPPENLRDALRSGGIEVHFPLR